MNTKQLHLCDFDGTLLRRDSFVLFLGFTVPILPLVFGGMGLIFKFLGLIVVRKWSNSAAKAMVFSTYFKGRSRTEMQALAGSFCEQRIPALIRADLLKKLQNDRQNGDVVVIVSASPDLWLRPFCAAQGFELLCTALEFVDDKFTGGFATPNCNGPEKAHRILAAYPLQSFDKIIAYGNSRGDEAMYALADEVFRF